MPCIMPTSLVRTLWATQLVEPGLATNVIRAVLACGVSAIFVVSSSSLKNGCAMPKVPYFRGMPRGRECAATVGLDWSWDCGACTMGVHGACGRGPNCEYSLHPPYRAALCRLLAVMQCPDYHCFSGHATVLSGSLFARSTCLYIIRTALVYIK